MGLKLKNPLKEAKKAVSSTAKQIVKQPIKGIARAAVAPAAMIAQAGVGSKPVQKFLDNKFVDQLTLGTSGDFAGSARAVMQVGQGKHLNKEDANDALRLGAKIGVAYGAAAIYNPGSSGFASKAIGKAVSHPIYSYLGAQSAQSAIKKGDYLGAAMKLGGADALNDVAPGAGDILQNLPTSRPVPVAQDNSWNPFDWFGTGGDVYSGAPAANDNSQLKTVAIIAAVVGVAYLAARKL